MSLKDHTVCNSSHPHHDGKYEDAVDQAVPLLGILAILGGVAISIPILMKLSLAGGAACLCMLFSSMALVKRYYIIGGIGMVINMLVLIYEIANPVLPPVTTGEYEPHQCRFMHEKMAKDHPIPGHDLAPPPSKPSLKPAAKPAATK